MNIEYGCQILRLLAVTSVIACDRVYRSFLALDPQETNFSNTHVPYRNQWQYVCRRNTDRVKNIKLKINKNDKESSYFHKEKRLKLILNLFFQNFQKQVKENKLQAT